MPATIPTPSKDVSRDPAISPAAAPREDWGWTRMQRLGLGILLAILIALLAIDYFQRPARLDDPVVIFNNEKLTLPLRIDPNTASLAELTRISHIGDKLGARIIAYREARKSLTDDGIVFHRSEDLSRVPGLGKAVLQQVRPYLQFPDDVDDSAP
jgi:hypothetical protein